MKIWKKIFIWSIPFFFILSAAKDLFICHLFAQVQGGDLYQVLQFWFGEQVETYNVGYVRALLRMQSAFYMVLIAGVFMVSAVIASKYQAIKTNDAAGAN